MVIVIVAILVVWGNGYEPVTAISLVLGAGLAGARVARQLIAGGTSVPSPANEAGAPT